MTTYSNDIYGRLLQIADLTGAPDTYSHDQYGQIKRIADAVGAVGTYSGDKYSQLKRIADQVGAVGTYPNDIYGMIRKIADSGAAGAYSNDIYGQLSRIVANGGVSGAIQLSGSSLAENSAANTAVGTLSVTGGTGTYDFTLTDDAGGRFKVAGAHGVNLQAAAVATNYEVATFHDVIVHADNGAGSTFDRTFSILVIDVNEAPVITSNGGGSTASVSVAENTTAVTTVTATDVDAGSTITYSISGGADAARFTIGSSSGVLAFLTAPDYEIPTDANTDNAYVVIVTASDGTNTDTQTITVTVTDVGEGGGGVALKADFSDANANEAWVFW